MASNIFTSSDYQEILTRIQHLSTENQRKWGSMSLDQMLTHCSLQLKLGLGMLEFHEVEGNPLMRTGFGKWMSLYLIPWPQGLPTPSKMNMMQNNITSTKFEIEQQQLITLLAQVQQQQSLRPHPFFGPLNQKDWGRLIWKHLDHHLKQFGG